MQKADTFSKTNTSNSSSSGVGEILALPTRGDSDAMHSESSLPGSSDSGATDVRKDPLMSIGSRGQSDQRSKSSKSSSTGSGSSKGIGSIIASMRKSKKAVGAKKKKAKPRELNWLRDTLSLNSSAHSSLVHHSVESSQGETEDGKPAASSSNAFRRSSEAVLGSLPDRNIHTKIESSAFASGAEGTVFGLTELQQEYARKLSLADEDRLGNEKISRVEEQESTEVGHVMAGDIPGAYPSSGRVSQPGAHCMPNDPSQATIGRSSDFRNSFPLPPRLQNDGYPRSRSTCSHIGDHRYPAHPAAAFHAPSDSIHRRNDREGRGLEQQGVPRAFPPGQPGYIDDFHPMRRYDEDFDYHGAGGGPSLQSYGRNQRPPHSRHLQERLPYPNDSRELPQCPSDTEPPSWRDNQRLRVYPDQDSPLPDDRDHGGYRGRQQNAPPGDLSPNHGHRHSQDQYDVHNNRRHYHRRDVSLGYRHDDDRRRYPLSYNPNSFEDPAGDSKYVGVDNSHYDCLNYDESRRKSLKDSFGGGGGSLCKRDLKGRLDHANPRESSKGSPQATSTKPAMVEISPGCVVPLRTTEEIINAVANDFFRPMTCICCSQDFFCIPDIQFAVCPNCQSIGPVEGDGYFEGRKTIAKGLGLGFAAETLFKMQQDILQNRHMHA